MKFTAKRNLVFSFLVQITLVALIALFCLRFILPNWEFLWSARQMTPAASLWLAASFVSTLGYYYVAFLLWIMILRSLGCTPIYPLAFKAYILSLLPKYVPGKLLATGVRTKLSLPAGISLPVALKSFLLEAVVAIGTASLISVTGLLYYNTNFRVPLHVMTVIFLVILILGFTGIRKRHLYIRLLPIELLQAHHITTCVRVVFTSIILWGLLGLTHWFVANALNSYETRTIFPLIVGSSASLALGVLSVFTPAGLGVREAALYFFVRPWMNDRDALLLATLSRLVMFGVEMFLTLGVWLYFTLIYRSKKTNLCKPLDKLLGIDTDRS